MVEGTVFNIQKYSIHDGPGIRTTVFLKGCPLNCWWCHNPESKNSEIEYTYDEEKCIDCGECSCKECEGCYEVCVAEAIEMIGKKITVKDVTEEVMKDSVFYEQSGGGVTVSGGEPFSQYEFLKSLVREFKRKRLHVTIDTCGLTTWDNIEGILDYTDLFLYDIKHMDPEKHRLYTGVSNEIILSNLEKLGKLKQDVWIRIPIIPGINDDKENIVKTAEFLKEVGLYNVFLLPYHKIMINKYSKLEEEYKIPDVDPPTKERMEELAKCFEEYGLDVNIGG